MGSYDSYGDCQIKVGPCNFNKYEVSDIVPIPDGVYITYEGVIVIRDHCFLYEHKNIFTKYGGKFNLVDALENHNPVARAIKAMK